MRLKTSCASRWPSARRNPSAHPPSTVPARWPVTRKHTPTPVDPIQNRLRHRSHPNDNSSVSARSRVLPLLPQSPSARPTSNHQHSRIHGATHPGDAQAESSWVQSKLNPAMGNSLYTGTPNHGLQQQMINQILLPIPTLHSALCTLHPALCTLTAAPPPQYSHC